MAASGAERLVHGLCREKHIEARMTSQVMYFEWFLNYKFSRYFADSTDRIIITESTPLGVDIYRENAVNSRPFTVWKENEHVATANRWKSRASFIRLLRNEP